MSQENEFTPINDGCYTTHDLVHLSDREHVRKRPGMYIGDTRKLGRHHLIEEVLSIMMGCFRAGAVSRISVTLHADDSVTICDDNVTCQLSIDEKLSKEKEQKMTNLEREVSSLHTSWGKEFFGAQIRENGSIPTVSMALVNFLSESFHVEACCETEVYRQNYKQGLPVTPVETSRRTSEQGTRIRFLPDPEIFLGNGQSFDYQHIHDRLEVLAYLNAGLAIELKDDRNGNEGTFQFPKGIREMLDAMTRHQSTRWFGRSKPMVIESQTDEIQFQVAMRTAQPVVSYVNETNCHEGGNHITCFFETLASVLNEIGLREGYLVDDEPIPTVDDYESEMQGIIHVQMKSPQWRGATKTRIGNPEFADFATDTLRPKLIEFFESNSKLARGLTTVAIWAADQRAEEC